LRAAALLRRRRLRRYRSCPARRSRPLAANEARGDGSDAGRYESADDRNQNASGRSLAAIGRGVAWIELRPARFAGIPRRALPFLCSAHLLSPIAIVNGVTFCAHVSI